MEYIVDNEVVNLLLDAIPVRKDGKRTTRIVALMDTLGCDPLVRCANCANYYKYAPKNRDYHLPHHDCYRDDDEWFCADGERRES